MMQENSNYVKELYKEAEEIYKEYSKLLDSKYNRGKDLSIYEKFSVYMATVIKRNINRIPPVDEIFLRGFEEKILDLESEEKEGVKELREIFQNKFEKLIEWSHKLAHAISYVRQSSETHEHSIRMFEHVLGAILEEISKEEENKNKVVELDENDQELINNKNDSLVSRLKDFLYNEENEYWKRNNGEEYKGEYNIFRDNGLFDGSGEDYAYTLLYKKLMKIITEEEEKAEKEIKEILNSYRNPYDRYIESVFVNGVTLVQLILGKDLKYEKGIRWDKESLAIKEVNIMRPIGVMVLMHYIGDYIRENKRLNKKSIIDISDEPDEFYISTGPDGTYNPIHVQRREEEERIQKSGKKKSFNEYYNELGFLSAVYLKCFIYKNYKFRPEIALASIVLTGLIMYVSVISGYAILPGIISSYGIIPGIIIDSILSPLGNGLNRYVFGNKVTPENYNKDRDHYLMPEYVWKYFPMPIIHNWQWKVIDEKNDNLQTKFIKQN